MKFVEAGLLLFAGLLAVTALGSTNSTAPVWWTCYSGSSFTVKVRAGFSIVNEFFLSRYRMWGKIQTKAPPGDTSMMALRRKVMAFSLSLPPQDLTTQYKLAAQVVID